MTVFCKSTVGRPAPEVTMYSKAKILGHPIHPMLVAFPVAFYTTTLVSFIVYAASADPFWFRVARVANWSGVVTALVAAVPGFIDWAIGIPRQSAAKGTGVLHMALNVIALLVFFANGIVYSGSWDVRPPGAETGVMLSAIGVLFTLPAGFLGWNLVQDHHVGVRLTPEQERLEPMDPAPPDDHHHPTGASYIGR
jgi:uncharacterized membrane protein